MKTYPSIPRDQGPFKAHVFDKLDGSNLRFEWTRKQGWCKFGTRKRLFDESDPIFGEALPLFHDTLAGPMHDIAKKERWVKVIIFVEFWGASSLAGRHVPEEPKNLTLFDIAPHKQGILPPREFVKLTRYLPTPKYFGVYNWGPKLIEDVLEGRFRGVTFEGVVGKAAAGNEIVMAKAKTKVWKEKIRSMYDTDIASKILES